MQKFQEMAKLQKQLQAGQISEVEFDRRKAALDRGETPPASRGGNRGRKPPKPKPAGKKRGFGMNIFTRDTSAPPPQVPMSSAPKPPPVSATPPPVPAATRSRVAVTGRKPKRATVTRTAITQPAPKKSPPRPPKVTTSVKPLKRHNRSVSSPDAVSPRLAERKEQSPETKTQEAPARFGFFKGRNKTNEPKKPKAPKSSAPVAPGAPAPPPPRANTAKQPSRPKKEEIRTGSVSVTTGAATNRTGGVLARFASRRSQARQSGVGSIVGRPSEGSGRLSLTPGLMHGTIAFVPTGREPGWITSEAGMFRIPPGTMAGFMVEGQACTFTSEPGSNMARNIEVASNIPQDRVDSFFDANGRTKWDAPYYVMQSYLSPRGTLTNNEFLAFDRLDVHDQELCETIEQTLNAFINSDGGMIYIGVRKGENIISGSLITREEQIAIQNIVHRITSDLWKPPIPDRDSRVSVKFIPICMNDGRVCRDFFVVQISIQGPLMDSSGRKIMFRYKRNNTAFQRQLGWNVEQANF